MTLMRLNRDAQEATQDVTRQLNTIKSNNVIVSPRTALTNQLQQLEKKQYELTKQQLAFAQVQKSRTKSAPNLRNSRSAARGGGGGGRAFVESASTSTSDNTMNSSVKSENLREIWKILDNLDECDAVPTSDRLDLKLTGVKPPLVAWSSSKPVFDKQPLKSSKTPRSNNNTSNVKKTTSKIRNYNIKD